MLYLFFFFNDTATTEIYTLSLHDALPISVVEVGKGVKHLKVGDRVALEPGKTCGHCEFCREGKYNLCSDVRSEEHTSELQSRQYLVCRLLLEKKKKLQTKQLSKIHFKISS